MTLMKKYPGKIYYVYRHLPLDSIHAEARNAAEASECAADQGKFWPYHDKIFDNMKRLSPENLREYAAGLRLNMNQFDSCFKGKKHAKLVQNDTAEAARLDITGTPGFIIGRKAADGMIEGEKINGAVPLENFIAAIEKYLK